MDFNKNDINEQSLLVGICNWIKHQPEYTGPDVCPADKESMFHNIAPLEYAELILRFVRDEGANMMIKMMNSTKVKSDNSESRWIRMDDVAGKILIDFLKNEPADSPLFEVSLKKLRALIVLGLEGKASNQ